jgi:high-affinity iron transporter
VASGIRNAKWAIAALAPLGLALASVARGDDADVQRLFALVRGVEREYAEAFDDSGQLVRPIELEEAALLLAEAGDRAQSLDRTGALAERVAVLNRAVDRKESAGAVAAHASEFRDALAKISGIAERVLPPEPPSAARGDALYRENCIRCHGERGRGDGPDAARSERHPPDFTDSAFMRGETPDDFFLVISLGRRRAAMPSWEAVLSVQERWDLVGYVWSLIEGSRRLDAAERLFIEHCARCHAAGASATGSDSDATALPLTALDRTGGRSDAELYAAISDGVSGTSMRGYASALSDDERWQLVAFVRSLSLIGDPGAETVSLEERNGTVAQRVAAAVDAYRMHEDDAPALAASAYLAFEPLEPRISTHDAGAVRRLEAEFIRLQKALRQPDGIRAADEAAAAVARALDDAKSACSSQPSRPHSPILLALGIALFIALGVSFRIARRH